MSTDRFAQRQLEQEGRSTFATHLRPHLARLLHAIGLDVVYTRGAGDELFYRDEAGAERAVLDMLGGFGASLFGHSHPALVERAVELLRSGRPFAAQGSARAYAGLLGARLSAMVGRTTGRRYVATLGNSGAEAVEAALKHAALERADRAEALLAETRRGCKALRLAMAGGPAPEIGPLLAEAARRVGVDQLDGLDELEERLLRHNRALVSEPGHYLAIRGAFHGKTTGAVKLTYNPEFRGPWQGVGLEARFLPAEDTPALLAAVDEAARTCYTVALDEGGAPRLAARPWSQAVACIAEPIQGEGGIHELSAQFLRALRAAADRGGFPLILDEIQSGMGRTGTFLASEPAGVRGDYYLFSKALGGGLAKVAALMVDEGRYVERFGYLHSSTFADDDFSSAVALSALDLLEEGGDALMRACAEKGAYLLGRLREVQARYPEVIADVRGRGLLIGVELRPQRESASALLRVAAEQSLTGFLLSGYLLNVEGIRVAPTLSANNTVRIEPSAYVSRADMDRLCAAIERATDILARSDARSFVGYMAGAGRGDAQARPDIPPRASEPAIPEGARRVACIAHFISPEDLLCWDPTLAPLDAAACEALLERASAVIEPFVVAERPIESPLGARASVTLIGLPLTAAQVMARLRDGRAAEVTGLIERAVELARRQGCTMVGFAGYTSIATGNCTDLVEDRLGLTSGNSLTAAAALEATRLAAGELGVAPEQMRLGIVGAAGNIGRALAEVEAETVRALVLVGRPGTRRRLERLAERLYGAAWRRVCSGDLSGGVAGALARLGSEAGLDGLDDAAAGAAIARLMAGRGERAPIVVSEDMGALRRCNVVICATNAPEPIIHAEHLAEGPLVICDVSVPGDVGPGVGCERPLARVIRGGIVRLPRGQSLSFPGMALRDGELYACLSEVALLGLAGAGGHFSYGTLRPERVRQIRRLAALHGFGVVVDEQ